MKLGAGPAFHLPDLAGVIEGVAVAPPETVRMETVYYDTADLRLARWGVSLRRRAGEGWTLKLAQPPSTPGKPGAVLERDELTFQGGAAKPPEAALEVVRAYVRKAELVPVARLSTVRRRVRLVDATGTRVAEVVDDEVSVRDGRRVAARFREIEVEVLSTNGVDGSDSVTLDVKPYLQQDVASITVDGKVSRQWDTGVSIINGLRQSGSLPPTVVVDLGTNGTVTSSQFDAMMRAAAGATKVVFVTVKVPRSWESPNNAVLRAGVARYSNTTLADWHSLSQGHPEWFYSDGYHLTPSGSRALASLIASVV